MSPSHRTLEGSELRVYRFRLRLMAMNSTCKMEEIDNLFPKPKTLNLNPKS